MTGMDWEMRVRALEQRVRDIERDLGGSLAERGVQQWEQPSSHDEAPEGYE